MNYIEIRRAAGRLFRIQDGINLDRVSAGSDKNLAIAVTFAPQSAANGFSIGQNQLTGTQGNAYRTQFTTLTMGNDTAKRCAGSMRLLGTDIKGNPMSINFVYAQVGQIKGLASSNKWYAFVDVASNGHMISSLA